MNSIFVETQVLTDAANRIENACGDYEDIVNGLYSDVDSMSDSWQGADNVAFSNQILSYRKDFNRIAVIVREYVDYLRNCARAYEETQSELASEAGRLNNGGY